MYATFAHKARATLVHQARAPFTNYVWVIFGAPVMGATFVHLTWATFAHQACVIFARQTWATLAHQAWVTFQMAKRVYPDFWFGGRKIISFGAAETRGRPHPPCPRLSRPCLERAWRINGISLCSACRVSVAPPTLDDGGPGGNGRRDRMNRQVDFFFQNTDPK